MSLVKRGRIWWIDLRHRRGRVRRSTCTSDKDAAQRQHDELKARLWQSRAQGRTLADALLVWVDERPRGASELRALRQIRKEYKDRTLIEVTPASLLDTWGSKKPATYNRLVNIIRSAMAMAVARGWIEAAPAYPRRKPPPVVERWLTADEWDAVYAELAPHLKPMALFAVSTGLRWSNVAGLTWDRVDLRRKLAWIPASSAKGGAALSIPLSTAAIQALQAAGERRTGYVFTDGESPPTSPKTGWNAAVRRAEIPHARWHDLRHTWASWHVMAGTPLPVLQRLGGWATASMVQRYAHLAPSHVAEFAGNAKPFRHKKATQLRRHRLGERHTFPHVTTYRPAAVLRTLARGHPLYVSHGAACPVQ